MSTVYAQEQQIKRLQKFILTYAEELGSLNGRDLIQEAAGDGVLHEGDLDQLPY